MFEETEYAQGYGANFEKVINIPDSHWSVGIMNSNMGDNAVITFLDRNYPMWGKPWQITNGRYCERIFG